MVTGEPIPVEKAPGDKVTGGTVNGTGTFVMRGRARRQRHAARADRAAWSARRSGRARRSSGWPTPSPAGSCRPSSLVAVVTFVVWAHLRSRAAARLRARQRRGGADHRVPVRARAWRRRCRSWSARGAAPSAGVLFRNAEALEVLEQVDTLVVDKTGTLTEGKPHARRSWSPRGAIRRDRRCCGSPRASSSAASIRWRPPSSAARASAASRWRRSTRLRVRHRQGRRGASTGAPVAVGNARLLADAGRRRARPAPRGPTTLRRDGRDRDVRRGRRRSRRASSASPIRSRPRPRRRSRRCTTKGCASSC